jgi:hypothetical protein
MRLARKTIYAVVHLSVKERARDRERSKKTRNHSAGTYIGAGAHVYIYFNLERNASTGHLFFNLDSSKSKKQNNKRREKIR